jgi:hypothetical protein
LLHDAHQPFFEPAQSANELSAAFDPPEPKSLSLVE